MIRYVLILLSGILLTACSVSYSFSGADIPANAKTFSVDVFENESPLASATYPLNITESLKDKLLSQTKLDLSTKTQGDIHYSGVITGYDVAPVAIQGNETAALNRFTISLRVNYINTLDNSKNFEKSFSRFVDFSSSQDFQSLESSLTEEINDQLVLDIFNASLGNW